MQDLMRNLLLGGGGGFSPQSLFTGGVEGALYDPSDLSTLYQDSAGTTPVTAVEQPVGLMLDKSKNLALGPELAPATSSSLTAASIDTAGGAVASFSGGVFTVTTQSSFSDYPRLRVNIPGVVVNRRYALTMRATWTGTITAVTVRFATSGSANTVGVITVSGNSISGSAVAAVADQIELFPGGANVGPWSLTITELSVRELPGNHATSTGAARPTLSARVNLLLATEDLTTANWTPTGVTSRTASASTATLPTGQNVSLTRVVEDSGNTAHRVASSPTISVISGTTHTASVLIKGGGVRDWLYLRVEDAASNFLWFNATTGATGTVSAGLSNVSVVSLGNGAWLASCTRVVSGSNLQMLIGHAAADNTAVYTGDGSAWFEAGGADLRATNDGVGIPAYQRVNTATDYDTNGFPFYLSFGGAQSMSTPANLDLTSTDKVTVFAGVRKLSDAARGMVTELSTTTSLPGTFSIEAPAQAAAARFDFFSTGTVGVAASAVGLAYAAPVTAALTGVSDISAPVVTLRINGTQVGNNTFNQGTGNYGTYPLFIGARNNSSLFFTGYLYSLIIQGAAASATQLASTEAWVNQKTKAY